jgi:hypothetical protein
MGDPGTEQLRQPSESAKGLTADQTMELSGRQLRTGIRSPAVLARQVRAELSAPIPEDTPRSPQRPCMNAALKRYFSKGRELTELLGDYDERVARSKRRLTAASEFANGRAMLERFAGLDRTQADPTRVLMAPARAPVLGHGVTMGADLAYQTPDGWIVRQLLTDDEIRRIEHLRMFATATALHFEARPDGGQVDRVELWMLRFDGRVAGWPRSLLQRVTPILERRMDEMAIGASGQAA